MDSWDWSGSVFGGRATFPFRLYADVYLCIFDGERSIAFKGLWDPEKVPAYLSVVALLFYRRENRIEE